MAKTVEKTDAKTEAKASKTGEEKPANKLKKVAKPIVVKNPPTTEMVISALSGLKNRQGVPLVAIRNYISKNYGLAMTKQRQTIIKNFMEIEFEAGRIAMANHDGKLDFTKRFKMAAKEKE